MRMHEFLAIVYYGSKEKKLDI